MDSAPKDGSGILLLMQEYEGTNVIQGSWGECCRGGKKGWRPRYYELDGSDELEPTYWHPIPQPPINAAKEGET